MIELSIYNAEDDSLADIDCIGHGRNAGYAEYLTAPAENAHRVETDMPGAGRATARPRACALDALAV